MKKITPLMMGLLAFGFSSQQANAQRFYERVEFDQPVEEVQFNTDYLIQNPWNGEEHYLAGTGSLGYAEEHAIYQFEDAGLDADGNQLYRLLQKVTGEYLKDPVLSGGNVQMTKAQAQAFVFTALPGVGMSATYNENGQNLKSELWDSFIEELNKDPRAIYDNQSLDDYVNALVFCNKNYATTGYKVFEFTNGPTWQQYAAQRIFNVYEAAKATAYNDLVNSFVYGYYPADSTAAASMFTAGKLPGCVDPAKVDEYMAAYLEAYNLQYGSDDLADSIYYSALDRLNLAKKTCEDNVVPVTPGFYVIDNNPAAGRPSYAGTTNACMYEKDGALYWAGFNKPDTMTVDDASYIWELSKAEDGGWYLRNYGTNRYAGSLSANYQVVPSTEGPKQVYDINHQGSCYFSLDQRGQNATYPALHADQNPGLRIVIWESSADASQWQFIPVEKSELEGIEGALAQNRLNKAAQGLLENAKADYGKGFVYSSEGCTRDSVFNVGDGLITVAAGLDEEGNIATGGQLISNAPEFPSNEPGNCYANLLDDDFTTYFHTVWSSKEYSSSFHNLDISLNEAVQDFNIKYAQRHNNSGGSPTKIHVYASNDTTDGNWLDQGYMTCQYQWEAEVAGNVKKNFIGISGHHMDAPYKYVRFVVEQTLGNGKTNDNLFWYWSELRMYKAAYDASLSLIEAVPGAVKDELVKQMNLIEEEIKAKVVKQETFDALKKAYDEFLKNYPDPQIVKNLLSEAKAQAENAEEGTDLGYFKEGASAELLGVLKNVEAMVKDVMTVGEVANAKKMIEDALAAFNAKLIVPEDGMFYNIKSATTSDQKGAAHNAYLYAMNNDESQLKYDTLTTDFSNRLHYIWKCVKHEDGSYSFMNCGTGTYLGNPKKNNVKVNMSFESDSLKLRSAKAAGIFNFVMTDNVFLNAQPESGNIVTWNSANGTDNSAFIIESADDIWDGESVYRPISNQKLSVVSLPYSVIGVSDNCLMYKVLGMKDGMLQLGEYSEEDVIEAAVPFVIQPTENLEDYSTNFYTVETASIEDLQYNLVSQEQNGLMASLQSNNKIAGGAIFFDGNVIEATADDRSAANSGFFAKTPEATDLDGLAVLFPENVALGIDNIFSPIVVSSANAGVYTITGVKVRNNNNVQGLPKGLYIVDGCKVLVK